MDLTPQIGARVVDDEATLIRGRLGAGVERDRHIDIGDAGETVQVLVVGVSKV
jgi:hypothetical protein